MSPIYNFFIFPASVLIVVAPVASIIGGFFIDYFGRLNTIKIAGIPGTIGWCLIAIANNIPTIIIGRALVGISSGKITDLLQLFSKYSNHLIIFQHGEQIQLWYI